MAKQNDSTTANLGQDPRAVLDATIDAARLADPLIVHPDGRVHAFIPEGYRLENVTDPDRLPAAIKQSITVDDRASLSAYANRFQDPRSIIIADIGAGTIKAALDWHHSNEGEAALAAQHCRHSVTLKLQDSEEFGRWNAMEDKMHPQADFAAFIEENIFDVIDPEQGTLLEICRDLEATQDNKFRSGVRLENGDRTFHYETETRTKGEVQVPTEITLSIPLYQGEQPVDVRAKFRFRVTPGGLMLGFRWHRVEYQRQATFRGMAYAAADDTGLPVYFGRY